MHRSQPTTRSNTQRHLCRQCSRRPALFAVRRRGRIRIVRDDDHDLCLQCWRDLRNSVSAADLNFSATALTQLINYYHRLPLMEAAIKRYRGVAVGDLLQYQFTKFNAGLTPHTALSTRRVEQVIGDGAGFRVEGGFLVNAIQVRCHIAMGENAEAVQTSDDVIEDSRDYGFCGTGRRKHR